mmetsp:Transcript_110/g.302  ORF Transcript_110/g.302 Transcript_110/m.302 type:complete len:623 (-) Transcript_110:79-1947(-)
MQAVPAASASTWRCSKTRKSPLQLTSQWREANKCIAAGIQESHRSSTPRIILGWSVVVLCRSFHSARCWRSARKEACTRLRAAWNKVEILNSNESFISKAIFVGILTGLAVASLNIAIHEIQELLFTVAGKTGYGTAWAPALGGLVTCGVLALAGGQAGLEGTTLPTLRSLATADRTPVSVQDETGEACAVEMEESSIDKVERAGRALTRAALAAVSLGTGNSLGPEGPAVELGANAAAYLGKFGARDEEPGRRDQQLGLLASGCAAGVSAGFNAPIAGLFFAVEVVKPPQGEMSESTVSRLLAAACSAAVVQIFLGSSPAVKDIVFSSSTSPYTYLELPVFMLLGALCGVASSAFIRARRDLAAPCYKKLADYGISRELHPLIASLLMVIVGLLGLQELFYQGFDNINAILSSASKWNSTSLVVLLVGKILLSAMCAESGLVGGVFAPAIFIGVAAGALYGQMVKALALLAGLPVASATCFAACGGAAALAGVCGVPLTAVVLMLELTAGTDYNICLPLISAVGLSVYVEKAIGGTESMSWDNMSKDSLNRVAMGYSNDDRAILRMIDRNDGGIRCSELLALDDDNDGVVSGEDLQAFLEKRSKEAVQAAYTAKDDAAVNR